MANKRDYELDPGTSVIDDTYSFKMDKLGLSEALEVKPSDIVRAGGDSIITEAATLSWSYTMASELAADTTLSIPYPSSVTAKYGKFMGIIFIAGSLISDYVIDIDVYKLSDLTTPLVLATNTAFELQAYNDRIDLVNKPATGSTITTFNFSMTLNLINE